MSLEKSTIKRELAGIQQEKNELKAQMEALKNEKTPVKESFTKTLKKAYAENKKNKATPPPKKPTVNMTEMAEEDDSEPLDEHDKKMAQYAQERTAKNAKKKEESDARVDKIAGVTKRTLEAGSQVIEKIKDSFREDEEDVSEEKLSPEEVAIKKKWQKGRETVARNQAHDQRMIELAGEKTINNAKKKEESEARIDKIAGVTKRTLEAVSNAPEKIKASAKEGAKLAGSAIANREGFPMEMTGVSDEVKEPAVEKEPSPFTHLFGNLGEKLTETVPGFEKLSNGQQLLVMQGIQERIYATVKSEAIELHTDSVNKSKKNGVLGWIKAQAKGAVKNFQVANNETQILEHFKNDTDGKLSALLKSEGISVADRIAKSGLEGYLAEDKKTIVTDYVGLEKNLGNRSEYTKAMAGEFNEAATLMTRIPQEWSFPEASRAQKEAYTKAEEKLKVARDRFLPILAADNANQKIPNAKLEAAGFVKDSETMIKTMRFLSADPNTMKRLESIGNTSAILRSFKKDTLVERSIYGVAGYAGKAALVGTLGTLAAPAVALLTGGLRGYSRAKDSIREQTALSRNSSFERRAVSEKQADRNALGFEKLDARLAEIRSLPIEKQADARKKLYQEFENTKSGKMNVGMGSSERHMKRLSETLTAIEANDLADDSRQELLSKLKTYTDFIETKLQLGQVNFGEQKNAFARQYDLAQLLHESQATIAVHLKHDVYANIAEESIHGLKDENEKGVFHKLSHDTRGLIQRMGDKNQANVEKARTRMVAKEVIKGAVLGALFAKLGGKVREYAEMVGWVDSPAAGATSGAPIKNPGVTPEMSTAEEIESKIQALKDSRMEAPKLETSPVKAMPVGGIETFSAKPVEVPNFSPETISDDVATATNEAINAPESMITEIKAGEGAAHALLRLKNNPNLTEGQREFFNRNLWAVAKDLRMVDPGTGGSIEVPVGATLSIEDDGSIVITDPKDAGARTLLGTVKADGEFVKNTSDELRYRLPKVRSIESVNPIALQQFSLENEITPSAPSERMIPDELLRETREAMGVEETVADMETYTEPGVSSGLNEDGVYDRLDAKNYKFSDKVLNQITRAEHKDIDRELSKYFGDDYDQNRTWKAFSKMDAQEFLERSREDFSSEYVGLYDDVTELANKLPLDPSGKNMEQYLNGLYEFNERDLAFKKEIADLTRERIVADLKKAFGENIAKSAEWKQVGEMSVFQFFSQDREDLSDKTKILYDNLSKLIVRVGKGPEVLPVGQRSVKNYVEYLYEMDTRNVLHAEIYN